MLFTSLPLLVTSLLVTVSLVTLADLALSEVTMVTFESFTFPLGVVVPTSFSVVVAAAVTF